MQSIRERLIAEGPTVQAVLERAEGNGGSKKAGEYLILLQRLQAAQALLKDIGCELKDLSMGLVDFPSYRGKELVYLCWRRGEPRVEFWHDLNSGFAGRKPL